MRNYFLIILALIPIALSAQDESKFGIKFSGFVKSDIFFDSRQTVDFRYGHFLLYPKNEELDINGDDINASPKFNILSIQTRLKGVITGPDALGAKTSGLIEGAFFGNIGSDVNGFRLRHAFVKLTWDKAELLVGQYWHPMFVTSCFPGTVSFNTGTPFQPFARNPQIRLKKSFGKVNLIGSLIEQLDFVDYGPNGLSSYYLINSGMPEMNFRFEYKSDNVLIGAGANYKSLKPRLSIDNPSTINNPEGYHIKANTRANGTSIFGYFKYTSDPITFKLYGISGQSMFSMINLGGYAESVIETLPTLDAPITKIEYTPTMTNSVWADVHTNGKTLQVGLFGGYSKNDGAKDIIKGAKYTRGANIDYVYRVSPRLIYNNGKFRIAPEIEYTVAAYATKTDGANNIDEKGKVTKSKEVANIRFLIGVYYFF